VNSFIRQGSAMELF